MKHMRVSIKGALRNNSFGGYTHEDGRPASPEYVKNDFLDRLARGERYFPLGDCPTFDPKVGCCCEGRPAE